MSGLHHHVVGRVIRRGVEAAQSHFSANVDDVRLDDHASQRLEPIELLAVFITVLIMLLAMNLIEYTLSGVMATLAMIESPTATVIVDERPPPYGDEPDAPIEKETVKSLDAEADVDVTLVSNKPITASVRATMRHLHGVGGFFAKWRGIRASLVYHFLHALPSFVLPYLLGADLYLWALYRICISVGLIRFHMVWTHAVIAYPSQKSFCRRLFTLKHCKTLLIPTVVFAVAQELTVLIPHAIFTALSSLLDSYGPHDPTTDVDAGGCSMLLWTLALLAVPISAIFVTLAIAWPAAVTLTRIEAILLPEGEKTIVPFDREAILGDIDLTARGSSRKLFIAAWRSFDSASRWRLIKVYAKLAACYFFVALTGVHVILAELYLMGPERVVDLVNDVTPQWALIGVATAVQVKYDI